MLAAKGWLTAESNNHPRQRKRRRAGPQGSNGNDGTPGPQGSNGRDGTPGENGERGPMAHKRPRAIPLPPSGKYKYNRIILVKDI